MPGTKRDPVRETVKGAAKASSNVASPALALLQSGDILKGPLEGGGGPKAQLPKGSAATGESASTVTGPEPSAMTRSPGAASGTGVAPSAASGIDTRTDTGGRAPDAGAISALPGSESRGANAGNAVKPVMREALDMSHTEKRGLQGSAGAKGVILLETFSEVEATEDPTGDAEEIGIPERSESWTLPEAGWLESSNTGSKGDSRAKNHSSSRSGTGSLDSLKRDSSSSWNLGEGQDRSHVLGSSGEGKEGKEGEGTGKEGSSAGKAKAVVRLDSAKYKKGSPLGCAFACCWATGLLFYIILIAFAVYSMLPQKQIQAIQEALLGSEPQPTPGDQLALQGFTAKHPVVFVPGIVTGVSLSLRPQVCISHFVFSWPHVLGRVTFFSAPFWAEG